MEVLIGTAVVIGLACWVYQTGKRTGSRKAYGAGRRHERRRWRYRRWRR